MILINSCPSLIESLITSLDLLLFIISGISANTLIKNIVTMNRIPYIDRFPILPATKAKLAK